MNKKLSNRPNDGSGVLCRASSAGVPGEVRIPAIFFNISETALSVLPACTLLKYKNSPAARRRYSDPSVLSELSTMVAKFGFPF